MKKKLKNKVATSLGRNVRRLRKMNNLKQEELAKMVGVDVKSLSIIETGAGFAAAKNIDKFASVFKVPISELFEEDYNSIGAEQAYSNVLQNLEFVKNNTSKLNTINLVIKSLI